MTPLEAAEIEVRAELAALARRIGASTMPRSITVRIEFDDATGMPRSVDCQEERRRRILGGAISARVPNGKHAILT